MKKILFAGSTLALMTALAFLVWPVGTQAVDDTTATAPSAIARAISVYCSNPEHLSNCAAFVQQYKVPMAAVTPGLSKSPLPSPQTGVINKARLEEIIKAQGGPGGCKTMKDCAAFCEVLANRQACYDFIQKNRLMTASAGQSPKPTPIKTGPGGCTGEACKAYCDTPTHADECISYAVKNGLISKEEGNRRLDQLKLQKELRDIGGPGGCKSAKECRTYCANQANKQACIDFASSRQLMTGQPPIRKSPSPSPSTATSQQSSFTGQFVGLIAQSFSDLSRQFFK